MNQVHLMKSSGGYILVIYMDQVAQFKNVGNDVKEALAAWRRAGGVE